MTASRPPATIQPIDKDSAEAQSANLVQANLEQLQRLFPEAFGQMRVQRLAASPGAVLLCGLSTTGVWYLVVEWVMRPLSAGVLDGSSPHRDYGRPHFIF